MEAKQEDVTQAVVVGFRKLPPKKFSRRPFVPTPLRVTIREHSQVKEQRKRESA